MNQVAHASRAENMLCAQEGKLVLEWLRNRQAKLYCQWAMTEAILQRYFKWDRVRHAVKRRST